MDPTTLAPTRSLADWVIGSQWQAINTNAKKAASRSLLNWLGCALGGASDASVSRLISTLQPLAGQGSAPLLGRPEKTDSATAALVHAYASNILDYDDTHWETAIHPAGPVASALVSWANHTQVSGEDFLHAFLLGMEVECRIGLAISPGHYEHGWHITATCGVFGAAVAVGRLMRLTPLQMTWAIGHAATQSSGLVASLGTTAKSLNIGYAARNGLFAAQMARNSMTANAAVLEAKFGFSEVMGTGQLSPSLCHLLGEHWECERNTFKPYPCGFLLHPALEACFALPVNGALSIDTIVDVVLTVHPLSLARADRQHPADGLESKLSLQHAVAVALLRHHAGVFAFTDAAVNDAEVRACRGRIRLISNKNFSTSDAQLTVSFHDGTSLTQEIRPSPHQPAGMSDAALERKFRELVLHGAAHCDPDQLLDAARRLPQADNVADMLRLTLPTA